MVKIGGFPHQAETARNLIKLLIRIIAYKPLSIDKSNTYVTRGRIKTIPTHIHTLPPSGLAEHRVWGAELHQLRVQGSH